MAVAPHVSETISVCVYWPGDVTEGALRDYGAEWNKADDITNSMKRAIGETSRRRDLQLRYNEQHGIIPKGIVKSLEEVRLSTSVADVRRVDGADIIFEGDLPMEELAKALSKTTPCDARESMKGDVSRG